MKSFLRRLLALGVVSLATVSFAQTTNTNFRGLPGLIYEAEDWTTPRDAWLTNQASATKWNLWTTEGSGKRSRDASLVSPTIRKDRAKPEDGAPVLHTHITGIPRGLYSIYLGGTTRPLAYSLDSGQTWLKTGGGETLLDLREIEDGAFDLWVDDRYANPAGIGSAYYDYIRFAPLQRTELSELAAFTLPGGDTQISWVSAGPTPAAVVKCDGREFAETETGMRNHRVVLTGLKPGSACVAHVRLGSIRLASLKFVAGARPQPRRSKPCDVELTVTEPTGQPRKNWPVTSGVPFARGVLASADHAELLDAAGKTVPGQFETMANWPDGSVKWLLVSFCADTANEPVKYVVRVAAAKRVQTRVSGLRGADIPVCVVRESNDSLTVENGRLSLRIGKEQFALFDSVTLDGRAITRAPMGGNGRILDSAGKVYTLGKPDAVIVEERGPVRTVVRVEGDFVAQDGARLFHWRARYFVHAGQPWVRLNWAISNNNTNAVLTNLQSAGIRLPFAADGAMRGGFGDAPAEEIKDDKSTWLLQDKDDHFAASVNGAQTTGGRAAGSAFVTDGQRRIEVVVKDFWQTWPKGIAIKPDGLHVRVLPPLPADAFAKESQNDEDLIRLYCCYDNGQYRVKRGLEFTTDIFVHFASKADGKLEACPTWFQQPLFAVAPPQHYCDSGVFGLIEPRTTGVFDAYEKMADAGFDQLEKNRREKHEYGWMNFGDWHGERHFNWGNHEYDMMGALALHFVRTGDLRYLWRADEAARHSTTIDTIHHPWQERMPGRVYTHCIGHVGGFFDMSDARFRRLGNVFGLSDLSRPNPFVSGAIDPGGHIFQPGNLRLGFLTGDRRYLEVAQMVCEAQAAHMTANFNFGIERGAGWPLMNAAATYEATGNPFFLNAARLYVEKILSKQTDRGDFNLPHGPPECLHKPSHPGGKAFAMGILLNGLMMFDQVAPSSAVKQCIVRSAHWLEKYSWNHETRAFRYIDTCPTFDKRPGNGSTDFVVSSGLAYACTLDSDPALKALLLDSLGRALRSSAKVGKDYIMDIRQTPHALAILHQKFGLTCLREPAAGEPKK